MSDKGKQVRYDAWIKQVKSWADKFGITTEQAVNISMRDQLFTGPNVSDLHWNEAPEFAEKYIVEN